MNQLSPLCAALVLFASACDPGSVTVTTTSGGTSSTASSSGGAGGVSSGGGGSGGATSSDEDTAKTTATGEGGSETTTTAGEGGSETTTSSSGTGGGEPGPCFEDEANIPSSGSMGFFPSKCHCKEEALSVLPMLAAAAKAVHDATGTGCSTAVSVPSTTPPGVSYSPIPGAGSDFQTGTDLHGWLCLDVAMPTPIHCRYSYTLGSAPVSAYAAGPTVNGPQDFEVAAEGDADADTNISVFSIRGVVDSMGELVLQPLFQHQPDE